MTSSAARHSFTTHLAADRAVPGLVAIGSVATTRPALNPGTLVLAL
ncbi:MAG TPA: hypothetical protein VL614_21235 [Acetobacteraceae bacterium]|jgi:hypothetical protein|nr:hypothetical protein [Acetobacteraceae bacterium]